MFSEDFSKYWMMTSSRVVYLPKGKDRVLHDFGYSSQADVRENIVGPDSWVTASSDLRKPMNAIVGLSDCTLIETVCEHVSGRKPYLWRINEKPAQEKERAVVLVVDYGGGDGFVISAFNYIFSRPARGAVVAGAKKSP
jgi:hypothetical protein